MARLFTNNARSTLNGAINSTTTSIQLTTGGGAKFPSPTGGDYFLATLIGLDGNGKEDSWEIVKCTARTGDVLTVVRDQEGTTNSGWASGTTIELRLTSALMGDLEKAYTGANINAATGKTTPIDADQLGLIDSAASNVLKKLTWANIKATLKTYFDSLYSATGHNHGGVYEPADATILKDADIGSTVQAHDADTAKTDVLQAWTAAQKRGRHALGNRASSVAWNYNNGVGGFTVTLTGNANIANPTNLPTLSSGEFVEFFVTITQDGTGGRVPTTSSSWKNFPTLSTDAGAKDNFAVLYDGTDLICGASVVI